MHEINIYNLTTHETQLMNTAWGLGTMEEFDDFRGSLSPQDQRTIDYLTYIAAMDGDDVKDVKMAKKVLAKFRLTV
jgi:hypothetical protein